MIVTITLNPAIDHTLVIDNKTNNKTIKSFKQAAGKGVNVSCVIHELGYKSIAATILAGKNGKFIKKELERKGIEQVSIEIAGNTRINKKIIDQSTGKVTERNELGPQTRNRYVGELVSDILDAIEEESIIIISGSIPPGLSSTVYKDLVKMFRLRHHKVILDASGENLNSAIVSKPFMIKPNLEEISLYAGTEITSIEEATPIVKQIVDKGVKEVILTMGDKGAAYFSKKNKLRVLPIDIQAANTVGAGDSFVAGYAIGLEKEIPLEERLIYASAVATCSVMSHLTGSNDFSQVKKLMNQIFIEQIKR